MKTKKEEMFVASPENQAEGERIFASHAKWMEKTNHKDGEMAMLSYNMARNSFRVTLHDDLISNALISDIGLLSLL